MGRVAIRRAVAFAVVAQSIPGAGADEMDLIFSSIQIEQFEYRSGEGDDTFAWDAQAWLGTDEDKAWFKTEGENPLDDSLEEVETQLLYSRRISDFFDVQVGGRYDFRPEPERAYGVVGLHGLAPMFVEIDTAAFLSEEGDLSARIKAEYDLLITQKVVLQPLVEVNVAAHEVEELGIGQGVNDVELGLRLRYEVAREFAPYIGVDWHRLLGQTADFARADGEDAETFSFVAGVRMWF